MNTIIKLKEEYIETTFNLPYRPLYPPRNFDPSTEETRKWFAEYLFIPYYKMKLVIDEVKHE